MKYFGPPSDKATGAGLAAALSTIFWVIAAATFWADTFSETTLATLTGATTTVLAFVGAYVAHLGQAYIKFHEHNTTTGVAGVHH